jgi:hypothetical protein
VRHQPGALLHESDLLGSPRIIEKAIDIEHRNHCSSDNNRNDDFRFCPLRPHLQEKFAMPIYSVSKIGQLCSALDAAEVVLN